MRNIIKHLLINLVVWEPFVAALVDGYQDEHIINYFIIMRKQPLLYQDNDIISRYHEITVHKKKKNPWPFSASVMKKKKSVHIWMMFGCYSVELRMK